LAWLVTPQVADGLILVPALVRVVAVADERCDAFAVVAPNVVRARCVVVTIIQVFVLALVQVFTGYSISKESLFASARISWYTVAARGVFVAVVQLIVAALIDVNAVEVVKRFEPFFAAARVASFRVLTHRADTVTFVRLVVTLVNVVTAVVNSVSTETLLASASESAWPVFTIGVGITIIPAFRTFVDVFAFITVTAVTVVAGAAVTRHLVLTRGVLVTFIGLFGAFINVFAFPPIPGISVVTIAVPHVLL